MVESMEETVSEKRVSLLRHTEERCRRCEGTGTVPCDAPNPCGGEPCSWCSGTGWHTYDMVTIDEPDWKRAQRLRLAAWDMLDDYQVSKTSEFYAWFDDEGVVQALNPALAVLCRSCWQEDE